MKSAGVAQRERRASSPEVAGSTPAPRSTFPAARSLSGGHALIAAALVAAIIAVCSGLLPAIGRLL